VLQLVGVGVGVEDADHRDAELGGLVDREVLALGVDDPDRARGLGEVADAAERLVQLVELALLDEELLLGEALRRVVEVDLLELLHAREALGDRLEVGEQSTEPALVDVGLAHAGRLLGDGLLRLLLGADEEDGAAVGDRLLDELVGAVDVGERLLQVDDVDAAALGEDEALDLRVPATGLVSEVDAAVEQLADGDDGHGRSPSLAGTAGPSRWFSQLSAATGWPRTLVPRRSIRRLVRGGTEGCGSCVMGTRSHPL